VKTFAPVGRIESECSLAFRPRETPLFSRGEEVDLLLRPQSRRRTLCIFNVLRSEYNLSLRKRDFLYSIIVTLNLIRKESVLYHFHIFEYQ